MKKATFKKSRIKAKASKKFSKLLSKKNFNYHNHLLGFLILTVSLLVAGSLFVKAASLIVDKLQINKILPTFNVKTDERDHTNFLLMGIGGEGHSGENLTDTIIVASLDHDNNYTTMFSIPRDLYVPSEVGQTKINNLYEFGIQKYGNQEGGIQVMTAVIEKIINMPIHYYIIADFQGFVDAVDTLGGLDIYLENTFIDTAYPKAGTFDYETFALPAGDVHLDGKTALKYVRSRHSTSDFSRSKRQHEILSLIKEKALSIGILSSPVKLKGLYESFSKNIHTNLEWDEIIALAKKVKDFPTEKLISQTIHTDPQMKGGFLYTPERQYFGNAYVLLPYNNTYLKLDNYQEVNDFAHTFHYYPTVFSSNVSVEIRNGTRQSGLARYTSRMLIRNGFNITEIANAESKAMEETTIHIKNPDLLPKEFLERISYFVPGNISSSWPPEFLESPSNIIIVLGSDYLQFYKKERERFY